MTNANTTIEVLVFFYREEYTQKYIFLVSLQQNNPKTYYSLQLEKESPKKKSRFTILSSISLLGNRSKKRNPPLLIQIKRISKNRDTHTYRR